MARLKFVVPAVAVAALVLPLTVVSPTWASTFRSGSVQVDEVWEPGAGADSVTVPEDRGFPQDPWQAPDRARFFEERVGGDASVMRAPAGTVVGAPGLGEMPWFSFQDFDLSQNSAARVNLANGNLLVTENDFAIAGPGYALRHDRFYNGLNEFGGSLGGGWYSSNDSYDNGLYDSGNDLQVYLAGRPTLTFTRNADGSYTAPAGSNLSVRNDPASIDERWIVSENQSGDQYKFGALGWYSGASDRNDTGVLLSFPSGQTKVTHNSGRSLTIVGYNQPARVEDSAGRKVTYSYDPTSGALNGVTAVDGTTTSYTYDSVGRLATMVLPGAGAATTVTFTYDSSHRVTKVAQQPGVETTFSYSAGKTTVTDARGNVATYSIDNRGRVTSAKDALGRSRSQAWNANSDITSTTDAFGSNTNTYTYDQSGNRLSAQLPTGAAAAAVYSVGAGCSAPNTGTAFQPKCSTDDAGNKKQYQYDSYGNQTKQSDTTTSTAVVEFERTYGTCGTAIQGLMCSSKDGKGAVTAFTYDSKGNRTKVTPPAPVGATSYTYDSLGRVTSVTDGNGDVTGYQYDTRDRIVRTTFDDAQTVVSTYFPNGLEKTRTDSGGGAAAFEYDHQGRILKQTGPRGGVTQTYTYDKVGNILSYTDSGGTTNYTYDAANQLTSLREPGGTCPTGGAPAANSGCVMFEYDVNGAETKRTLPGGATTTTVRDNAGRPTRITAKAAGGATAVDIGYSYAAANGDDRANVQSRTAHKEEGVAAGAVTTYSYDSRKRLTRAEEKTASTVSASWAYTYDANSNRTQQVRTGSTGATAGTINYGYNAANQLTSATGQSTTWTYDAAGNQTRNGTTGTATSFGDRGEATQIGNTANTYFNTGNTDRLTAGSVQFNNSALGLMQRTSGNQAHNYTRTPDGAPVGLRASGQHYYVHDHLGSIVGMFTATGTYSGGYSYAPYGEARATSTNGAVAANNLRYIGEHHEGGGVYKLGARYYDTTQGRFTQMDPSGQEKNPYAYAACNPVTSKDPSGLSVQCGYALFGTASDLLAAGGILAGLIAAGTTTAGIGLAAGTALTVEFLGYGVSAAFGVADIAEYCF